MTCVSVTSELSIPQGLKCKFNKSAADFLASGFLHNKQRREKGEGHDSIFCTALSLPSISKTPGDSVPARQRVSLPYDENKQAVGRT